MLDDVLNLKPKAPMDETCCETLTQRTLNKNLNRSTGNPEFTESSLLDPYVGSAETQGNLKPKP